MASGKLFRFPQFSFLLSGKVVPAISNNMFSLWPLHMLRFSGKAALALQGPSQGGCGCRDTSGHCGRGAPSGNLGREQVFSFVTKSFLHPLTAATSFAVKITVPVSCFIGSHIGNSSPNSRFNLSSCMLSPPCEPRGQPNPGQILPA